MQKNHKKNNSEVPLNMYLLLGQQYFHWMKVVHVYTGVRYIVPISYGMHYDTENRSGVNYYNEVKTCIDSTFRACIQGRSYHPLSSLYKWSPVVYNCLLTNFDRIGAKARLLEALRHCCHLRVANNGNILPTSYTTYL